MKVILFITILSIYVPNIVISEIYSQCPVDDIFCDNNVECSDEKEACKTEDCTIRCESKEYIRGCFSQDYNNHSCPDDKLCCYNVTNCNHTCQDPLYLQDIYECPEPSEIPLLSQLCNVYPFTFNCAENEMCCNKISNIKVCTKPNLVAINKAECPTPENVQCNTSCSNKDCMKNNMLCCPDTNNVKCCQTPYYSLYAIPVTVDV